MSNFGDFIWLIASTFLFVGCLLILFRMISDLFQDSALGGGSKALWRICLLFVPILTALVYVVTPSKGMVKRQRVSSERSRSAAEPYIQQVAGTSPAEQIPDAKALLDANTINQEEFARLKRPSPERSPAGGAGGPPELLPLTLKHSGASQ
jgi:hypothetical protein